MNLIQTAVAFVAVQARPDQRCLLQKTSATEKLSSASVLAQDAHRNWREGHKQLLVKTSRAMDVLDKFIAQQEESGDACSSRLMESKRVLDGLLKDLTAVSEQVDSHEEVLETETETLKITEMSVKAVKTAHAEAIAKCEKEKQDAAKEVSKYQAELAELDQIAKPSVRYKHVTKLTISGETDEEASDPSEKDNSFLQQGAFTKEACVAFLKLIGKRQRRAATHDPKKCDAQRDKLQKAFEKAYIDTRKLLKDAEADVEDTTCTDTAKEKQTAELVPLVSERERATLKIRSSTQSLASVTPVLNLLEERVEKLSDHIENFLTPECAEAKEVSEVLEKVRELILVLEECPGRNDFKLKIPEAGDSSE